MLKNVLAGIAASALSAVAVCSAGFSVGAATIDDVAETARSLGFPESYIQQGYNQYYENPDKYTSEVLDSAIAQLYGYEDELKNQLGIESSSSSSSESESSTESSSSQEETSTESETESSESSAETSSAGTVSSSQPTSEENTSAQETTSSIPNKPSKSEFINMTLEEKREYVSTLTSEQQQQFFNELSAEELKSIVNQLPADDKVNVVDTFVQAGEAMGIKVTVDSIDDEGISMSMRNEDGELIDIAAVGVMVENTGYDYRGIFAVSGALLLAAAGCLWLVIRKCFGREAEGENE